MNSNNSNSTEINTKIEVETVKIEVDVDPELVNSPSSLLIDEEEALEFEVISTEGGSDQRDQVAN